MKEGNRKRKYFPRREHGTVRGTKSVDLAVTSEIVRRSYITRPLNFFQGQQEDRLNKITGLFAVSGYLTPPIISSEGPVLRMEWFFPREGEGQEGATYLSARRRQRAFVTRPHQSQNIYFYFRGRKVF